MISDFDFDIQRVLKDRAKSELWDKTELRRIKAVDRKVGTLGKLF